jgi:hypothetical protein
MKNKIILQETLKENEILNEYQTMKQLKLNNIIKERVELYRDFVVNLIYYIHTSYLGKEYIKTNEDLKGHYNWAFNKVLFDFEKEDIVFGDTDELREYFFEYFKTRFYYVDKIPSQKTFISFWDEIFLIKNTKEKALFNALVDIYKLFDDALNGKNILDKVL